jgi:hypothetical protein
MVIITGSKLSSEAISEQLLIIGSIISYVFLDVQQLFSFPIDIITQKNIQSFAKKNQHTSPKKL